MYGEWAICCFTILMAGHGMAAGSSQWKYCSSEMVGDTMVMTGGEGKDQSGEFIEARRAGSE